MEDGCGVENSVHGCEVVFCSVAETTDCAAVVGGVGGGFVHCGVGLKWRESDSSYCSVGSGGYRSECTADPPVMANEWVASR